MKHSLLVALEGAELVALTSALLESIVTVSCLHPLTTSWGCLSLPSGLQLLASISGFLVLLPVQSSIHHLFSFDASLSTSLQPHCSFFFSPSTWHLFSLLVLGVSSCAVVDRGHLRLISVRCCDGSPSFWVQSLMLGEWEEETHHFLHCLSHA